MAFFQIVFDSVHKCLCSLGDHSDAVGDSIASKPKGASYSEFSPPKLRITDLSTNLSSNIEDNHIFASTSRYSTPLPSTRYADQSSPGTLDPSQLTPTASSAKAEAVQDTTRRDVDSADRKTAEVLAKARIEAMKGTAIRNRRTIGAEVTHTTMPSPSLYSSRPLNEKSHKRRMEIFRPRRSPGEEIVEPKRSYHCGASADDAFYLATSIFRAHDDHTIENSSPLPMLCFAKPIREDSDPDKRAKNLRNGRSLTTTDSDDNSSTASSCIYQDTQTHLSSNPLRPMPLYDHYLVMVSDDHKDEIARIMKIGTHKSFEWMHFDDSSEYMNAGSEDKQDHSLAKRLSHDDVQIFEGTSTFLAPVTEENEAALSIVLESSIESLKPKDSTDDGSTKLNYLEMNPVRIH
jgi:hypothetical protein